MTKLLNEIYHLTDSLLEKYEISDFEALQIAVKLQNNRILSDAFMIDKSCPGALESIAMELGASKDGLSIKDAIYNLKE